MFKQELERLPLTELAVLCQHVSDDPSHYPETGAAEAAKLKLQWVALQRSPSVSFKEEEEMDGTTRSLKSEWLNFSQAFCKPVEYWFGLALNGCGFQLPSQCCERLAVGVKRELFPLVWWAKKAFPLLERSQFLVYRDLDSILPGLKRANAGLVSAASNAFAAPHICLCRSHV